MLSRALSLATVTLLMACCAAAPSPALAQATNLEAGKSPSQIFAGTCNACHKGPRGLLKTVPAGSLQGFLRQHYTTSPEMASLLSAFLISNGATDTRYSGAQAKPAKDAKSEAPAIGLPDHIDRFGRRVRPPAPAQEAAKPDSEPQQAAKRPARPGEPAEAAKPDGQPPAQATLEHGPDGRKTAGKQKLLSKRGRPGEELPKADVTREEPAKGEAPQEDKPNGETAKEEGGKPPTEAKPEAKPESAKIEAPKETGSASTPPVLRADPVPPVTPAPSASPAISAAVSSSTPEPAPPAAPAPAAPPTPAAPPAVTASVPPPAPTGPPAPPISQ
jgi:hypothetical protein